MGEVEVNTGDVPSVTPPCSTVDGEGGIRQSECRPEVLKNSVDICADLGGLTRPSLNADLPPGNQRCCQEGCCVGEIGLDLDIDCADGPRCHPPHTRRRRINLNPPGAQAGQGHLDVVEGGQV